MALTQLERGCIAAFRAGKALHLGKNLAGDIESWSGFVLHELLDAARLLRQIRIHEMRDGARLKSDGSPTIEIEQYVEARLREHVALFSPETTFMGEESGGELPSSGFAVAVDPVDGTWAFINGMETFAVSITVFHDREAVVAAVCNPSTGEIAYTAVASHTRLIQLSTFGEEDDAVTLPTFSVRTRLVNIHPNRAAGPLLHRLQKSWQEGTVGMVRSPGGSPAWAMVEAAKGRFIYVNLWSGRSAEPYDLAGSVLLLRAAGGDAIDISGKSINPLKHSGPFIAAVNPDAAETVRRIISPAVGSPGSD